MCILCLCGFAGNRMIEKWLLWLKQIYMITPLAVGRNSWRRAFLSLISFEKRIKFIFALTKAI